MAGMVCDLQDGWSNGLKLRSLLSRPRREMIDTSSDVILSRKQRADAGSRVIDYAKEEWQSSIAEWAHCYVLRLCCDVVLFSCYVVMIYCNNCLVFSYCFLFMLSSFYCDVVMFNCDIVVFYCDVTMGWDLGGTAGTVPQSLRWEDVPCIRPPTIWRSSVMGCAGKYEMFEKCEMRWSNFLWNRGFW